MVLEARKDAEKIGYATVGEKTKESSDVIDYNINEEITTDTSSVFNANNDTTTGMATVIPGVNAPKLIQTTSIYQNGEGRNGGVTASASLHLSRPNDDRGRIRIRTLSNQYGNIGYYVRDNADNVTWNGLVIPQSGRYEITINYPTGGSTFSVDTSLQITKGGYGNDVTILSHTGQYSTVQETETIRYQFSAGDALNAYLILNYRGSSSSLSGNFGISMTITKL